MRGSVVLSGLFLLVSLALCSCSKDQSAVSSSPAKPVIVVSILPQTYFTGRIAGDRVRTVVLVGPGQNPHSYEPSPQQMADLAGAQAWILSGSEFEPALVPKIEALFSGLTLVNGVEGVRFRALDAHDDQDDDADHDDDGRDRHTWLGSEPAKIMASHILETLSALDSSGAAVYRENYEALIRDIDDEFNALRRELLPLRGRPVFVYHPAFGYFLDEFGIIQEAVETGGKEPTPRILGELIERAKKTGAAAVFVQAQFPVNAARTVAAAIGAELVSLDPLSPDWLTNIRVMGEALKKALPGVSSPEAAP
jgi:zinc transport system substrate-binding protein